MNPEIEIRYTRPMDALYLKKWLENPKVFPHFSMSNEKEREDVIKTWMFFSRYQASLTATIGHVPCGMATLFLMPYKKVSHHCSFKICVDPDRWNLGIGTMLLDGLKHLAKEKFRLDAIHIEVFGDNPLISLLKKFEFHEFARQENYVKEENGQYKARTCFIAELKQQEEA